MKANVESPFKAIREPILFIIDQDTVSQPTIYNKEKIRIGDTTRVPIRSNGVAIIIHRSKKGDAYVMLIDSNNIVRKEGKFCSADGELFKKYFLEVTVTKEKSVNLQWSILEFYQPLRDGVWIYRNSDGLIVKEELWSQGISSELLESYRRYYQEFYRD